MFIGLSSHCQRRFGYCQRLFPSRNSSLVETSHEGVELLAVELPMEGMWMSVVKLREMLKPLFDLRQRAEGVRCEDLALNDRKIDFNLIEPTRMHRRMHQDGIGVFLLQTLHGTLTTMRRAIIHNPKHPLGMTIRLLLHHLIDQTPKRCYPCFGFTTPQHDAATDIPGRQILQGAPAFVFRFDAHGLTRPWCQARMTTDTGLDTRLFVATDHEIVGAKRLAVPEAGVQIQNRSGLGAKAGSARENPVTIPPR